MKSAGNSIHAYLELMRLSNAPTVVSNVLVGVAISYASSNAPIDWQTVGIVCLSMLLLYVAGMALNDVVDAQIDKEERPERPIPSGRISISSAIIFSVVCLVLGLAVLAFLGRFAFYMGISLAVMIILYDITHKKWPVSVLFMGCCRGLVYLASAAAVVWPLDWSLALPLAGTITLYIILLTMVARLEAKPESLTKGYLALVIPVISMVPLMFLSSFPVNVRSVSAGTLLIVWLLLAWRYIQVRPAKIQKAVLTWLAGISLVDAFYLTLLNQPILMAIAIICFMITVAGHRVIKGA